MTKTPNSEVKTSSPGSRIPRIIIALVVAQLAVILASWLWSAAMPESAVRSLLGESGIRWFFGSFVSNLLSPLLVWILLLDIAVTACRNSGLWGAARTCLMHRSNLSGQQRSGLRSAAALVVVEAVVMALLVVPRHAILLSVTGRLFPSSFSESLVPTVAFAVLTASIAYGLFGGTMHNYRDVVRCAVSGGGSLKVLLAIYVLAMELWCMVAYVLML